jgi:hypothetical protein
MPLAFSLPDESADVAQALRDLEPQAPKAIKAVMLQAATELDAFRRLCEEGAQELELAANLRAGQMDSQSRADEIANQVRQTLRSVAARMRSLA